MLVNLLLMRNLYYNTYEKSAEITIDFCTFDKILQYFIRYLVARGCSHELPLIGTQESVP